MRATKSERHLTLEPRRAFAAAWGVVVIAWMGAILGLIDFRATAYATVFGIPWLGLLTWTVWRREVVLNEDSIDLLPASVLGLGRRRIMDRSEIAGFEIVQIGWRKFAAAAITSSGERLRMSGLVDTGHAPSDRLKAAVRELDGWLLTG